jgi:membrane protease YdiL (CAAX protease family)
MQSRKPRSLAKPAILMRQAEAYVRDSPRARSVAYFGSAAVLVEVVAHLQDRRHPYALVREHLTVLPVGVALTYAFVCLRPEDRARWNRVPLRQGLSQTLQGSGLGAGAFFAWLGIAAARGWLSAPAWGWEQTSGGAVVRSMALLGLGHLAVAWNEEMVFRGYGFEVLRAAIGQGAAVGVLIPFFALYHGLEALRLLGTAAPGATLMLLRLQSDALWLPIGYHWSWNVCQSAIFGPVESMPSLRPLKVHGPPYWVGRPGEAEEGLLSILIHLTVGVVAWLCMRHRHRRLGSGATM